MKFSRAIAMIVSLSMPGLVAVGSLMVPNLSIAPATAQMATVDTAALERDAHNQINAYRKSKGLTALTWNETIAVQARKHSQNMANGQTPFGHSGFADRVAATKIVYSGAAENVAYNQGYTKPADQAVKGWLLSPGHKKNIEGNYKLAGLGVVKNAKGEIYFTQVFINPR
jgi:uncharacterized protein YkwD